MTMKNWLPAVPAASACVFAIATTPSVYLVGFRRASPASVPGPFGAGAGRVAALDHEAGDDPVEDRADEEAAADEADERRRGLRRVLHVEPERNAAAAGHQRHVVGLRRIERRRRLRRATSL